MWRGCPGTPESARTRPPRNGPSRRQCRSPYPGPAADASIASRHRHVISSERKVSRNEGIGGSGVGHLAGPNDSKRIRPGAVSRAAFQGERSGAETIPDRVLVQHAIGVEHCVLAGVGIVQHDLRPRAGNVADELDAPAETLERVECRKLGAVEDALEHAAGRVLRHAPVWIVSHGWIPCFECGRRWNAGRRARFYVALPL